MRPHSPTLAELRLRAHKGRHREVGNWLARRVARPAAIPGTWVAVRLGMTAHQVTALATLAGLGAAISIASGTRWGFVAGSALTLLAFWLDHVDGQVARWTGTASLDGVFLDYLMHHAIAPALGFGLGYGLAARTGDLRWSAAGFLVASGWLFLGLSNDARYKAFFQRLKAAPGAFRVEGGAGGRPAPPARWPHRGRAALTWPAYKACEPHVVLGAVAVLAGLAVIYPPAWLLGWRWGVRVMAGLAPLLALARVARISLRRDVEREFAAWFRPIPGPETGGEV